MTGTARALPPPPPPAGVAAVPGGSGRSAPAPSAPTAPRGLAGRFLRPLVEAKTWKATAQLLLNLPFGIAWFTVIVTGFSVGVGTLITLIGIPILLLLLLFSRVISAVERARSGALLDAPVASPFRPLGGPGSLWQQLKALVSDGAAWKAGAFGLVAFPFGIATFVVTVVLWSVGLAGATYPLYGWSSSISGQGLNLGGVERFGIIVVTTIAGWAVLLATPHVVRGMASLNRGLVRGLLGPSGAIQLQQRVEALSESREASVDAAEAERRRIERDLHDGAQQRLVALAMDLGLAKERMERGEDPAGTAQLVGQAHDEAKRAITELRELVRGIHPAVLADRGLDAALSSVAARCPIPVELLVELPDRPPAAIEATAYFVVAEALTNVAKHSRARSARVRVSRRGPLLSIEVTDDGIGGAAVQHAGGLAGLRDRVRAVEGTLRLASPPGGPTTLLAELPCGS
jgi:signal transduction histidine kinase